MNSAPPRDTRGRAAGVLSAPHLLNRIAPFVGAGALAITVMRHPEMEGLTPAGLAGVGIAAGLILSRAWPGFWERMPRAVRPVPAAAALALAAAPASLDALRDPAIFLTMVTLVVLPFASEWVPWSRVSGPSPRAGAEVSLPRARSPRPRWFETLFVFAGVATLLLLRWSLQTSEFVLFPMAQVLLLFVALYGSRRELTGGIAIVGAALVLPVRGEHLTLGSVLQDAILTSLTAVMAASVYQVVELVRRQKMMLALEHDRVIEQERWIQSILENTADGVVAIDEKGVIQTVNRAARDLFGDPAADYAGRPVSDLIAITGHAVAFDLAKHVGPPEVGLSSSSRESIGIRSDGVEFPIEYSANEIRRGEERIFIISVRDITDRNAETVRLEHRASHDDLTGLPNRAVFDDRFEQALGRARRAGGTVALMMLDFDSFKEVNDLYGHAVGDQVLQEFGRRMTHALRASDTVARTGGDEFLVLPAQVKDVAGARQLATRLIDAAALPMTVGGQTIPAGVSIGIAFFPANGSDAKSLLRQVDLAMYTAKRGRLGFFVAPGTGLTPAPVAA